MTEPVTKPVIVTNRQYARENNQFIKLCRALHINPTKRQASKYRRGLGKAYQEEQVSEQQN